MEPSILRCLLIAVQGGQLVLPSTLANHDALRMGQRIFHLSAG